MYESIDLDRFFIFKSQIAAIYSIGISFFRISKEDKLNYNQKVFSQGNELKITKQLIF